MWDVNSLRFILLLTDLLTWRKSVAKYCIVSKASSTSHSWFPYSGVLCCLLWNSSQPTWQMYVYLFKWLPTGVNVGGKTQGGSRADTVWNLAKGNWGWIQMRPGRKERNGTALSGSSLALNFYTSKEKCWSVLGASCRGFYTWVRDCEQVNVYTRSKNVSAHSSRLTVENKKGQHMLQCSFRNVIDIRSIFQLGNTAKDTKALL